MYMDYLFYFINKWNELIKSRIVRKKQVPGKVYIYIYYTFIPLWIGRYKKVRSKFTNK